MKLTMKNIGVIRDGEIELDGITVLAGLNGTGKSTTSKALYGVIAPYVNLSENIADERIKSVRHIISYDLISAPYETTFDTAKSNLCFDLANKLLPIPERYEDWLEWFPELQKNRDFAMENTTFPKFLEKLRKAVNRPDMEYIQYLAYEKIKPVFDGQINTIGSALPGEIALTTGQGTQIAWMKIAGNKVVECSGEDASFFRPIYFDTLHILDRLNIWHLGRDGFERESSYNFDLYYLLESPRFKQTLEEYESRERVLSLIASVIHGKLARSAFGEFIFKDDRFNEPISLRNVASGNKTFALLQYLTEQGALRENTLLIIDEPESNQHPQWQLKLAETLVLLHKELGVRLFLNTHSTYFLRAIEVYSNQYELSSRCHYYQTQPVDGAENLFRIQNVDGKTKLIYHEFYLPFEEL